MNATPATNQIRLNRKVLIIVSALVLVAAGGWAFWKYISDPPKPWLVRWRVTRYLKTQSDRSDFKTDFQFPSAEQMAKAPPKADAKAQGPAKGKLTGKDFDALKSEYITLESAALVLDRKIAGGNTNLDAELKTKREALAPILSDLWDFQRVWLAEMGEGEATGISGLNRARGELVADVRQKLSDAASYGDIYQSIGQELWVAQRLFSSANPEHRRVGVSLALQASQIAQDDAQNGWLAGRICEGYVWPHLDVADDKNPRSPFYAQTLLTDCGAIFRRNDEWENVVRNFELLLTVNPQQADWARVQIGTALEQMGDAKRALQYFRAIKATNDYPGIMRRIPRLERQVRGK